MITIAAFYRFARFADPNRLRDQVDAAARGAGLRGTILIANEGINGTVAGPVAGIEQVIGVLRGLPGCADLDWKHSEAARMPFRRLKVRVKREIVTIVAPRAPTRRGKWGLTWRRTSGTRF